MNLLAHNRTINPSGGLRIGKEYDITGLSNELGAGLRNLWYTFTGQTEKTTAYQAQIAREDSAYQRAAEDMSAAGLSKYQGISGASTGSYGDGVPKGLQYISALMDLKAKKVGMDATQAGIQKTLADAAYTNAQTIGQQNTNRTFDEKFASDMAHQAAQTFLFKAQKDIAEIEGQFTAEKLTAEIDYKVSQTANMLLQNQFYPQLIQSQIGLNKANTSYTQTRDEGQRAENAWIDAKNQADYDKSYSQISLNNSNIQVNRKVIDKYAADIALSICNQAHVSAQTKKVVEETAYQMLQYNIAAYNLAFSFDAGLRTTDPQSKIFGVNVGQFSGWLRNALSNNPAKFINFRY